MLKLAPQHNHPGKKFLCTGTGPRVLTLAAHPVWNASIKKKYILNN